MGHIPREISRYVYFLIKEKNGKGFGTLKLLKYKVSPIPSGGLQVPFSLTFSCKEKWVVKYHGEIHSKFLHFQI